jgi:hypothetical protein
MLDEAQGTVVDGEGQKRVVTGDEERWANIASLRLFNKPLAASISDFDKAGAPMDEETLASLIALGREIEAADASRALGEDFDTTKGGLSEETVTSPMEAGLGSEVVDASRPQRGRMTRFQTWVVGVHSLLPGFVRVRRRARKETCSKGTTSHVIIPSLFLLIGVVWLFQALTPAWGLVPGEWSPARILLDAVPLQNRKGPNELWSPTEFLLVPPGEKPRVPDPQNPAWQSRFPNFWACAKRRDFWNQILRVNDSVHCEKVE